MNLLAGTAAIDLVSYNWWEMRRHGPYNTVYDGWMRSFLKYSENGFPNGNWEEFIVPMIRLNELTVQMIEAPSKNMVPKGRPSKHSRNIALQYDIDIGEIKSCIQWSQVCCGLL